MKNLLTRPQLLQKQPHSNSLNVKRKFLDEVDTEVEYLKMKKKGYQQVSTIYASLKKY
jgi:hypothetical protein